MSDERVENLQPGEAVVTSKNLGLILQIGALVAALASSWFSAQNTVSILQLELRLSSKFQSDLEVHLRDYARKTEIQPQCMPGGFRGSLEKP